MTFRQMNEIIALHVGCKFENGFWTWEEDNFVTTRSWNPPNYCTDLNAICDAEYSLSNEQIKVMEQHLAKCTYHELFRAAASQRAEAFLKTIGKWEDAVCKCGKIMSHDDGGKNYCCACGYDTGHPCSQDNLVMNAEEEAYWIEAGLQCHGVELDQWTKDAIVRYGRFLTERFLTDIHDLRLDNSGQALSIEKLKTELNKPKNNE